MARKVTAQTFEDAIDSHAARLTELGDRVRKERIIPLCDKNGWSFVSGMGTWIISDMYGDVVIDAHGDNLTDALFIEDEKVVRLTINCELSKKEFEELQDLWNFLNYDVMFRNSCVADWIEEYRYK
jgi:hypothetical protein